jgi:hypothetical protein
MRVSTRLLICLALLAPLRATTLEQLSLDEMIQKSTAIVRARVTGSHSAARGGNVYTYFQLQVLESWKGSIAMEVAVPGGVADGIRQSVAGAPELKPGREYVLFLWTSRSGLTQLMGLSQGLFHVSEDGSGGVLARRPPASELMLDRSGNPVEDRSLSIQIRDLRAQVLRTVRSAK